MMEQQNKTIVFMGTPGFAVPSLQAIVKAGYRVGAVVTAPDRPAGRGRKLRQSPVKEYALENGLTIWQPEKLKSPDFIARLNELKPWLIIVVAFRMLPRQVWALPTQGTFNLHASLLPDYRGAAPINHAIVNGDRKTGLTTFLIDDKIDTGQILLQEEEAILPDDNAGSLHDRLMAKGASLVVKTIKGIEQGSVTALPQQENQQELRPAPKIDKDFCRIDWALPAENVRNHIRGLSPYPAAWTTLKSNENSIFKIYMAKHSDGNIINDNIQPGIINTNNKSFIRVKTTDAWLEVEELQMSGKKRMKTEEFLRGYTFTGGEAFV